MESDYNNLDQIEQEIREYTKQLSKYDKTKPKEYAIYYGITKKLEELYRIKNDYLYGTHFNDVFKYKNRLKTLLSKYVLSCKSHKQIYQSQIKYCIAMINYFDNLDKEKTLLLKK